jgi:hypothetical protein
MVCKYRWCGARYSVDSLVCNPSRFPPHSMETMELKSTQNRLSVIAVKQHGATILLEEEGAGRELKWGRYVHTPFSIFRSLL